MTFIPEIWAFLSQDVSFLGGPESPMLSWLGSLGILIFFLRNVYRLRKELSGIRQGLEQISPRLAALVTERGEIDKDRFTPNIKPSSSLPRRNEGPGTRIDCDDLHQIDTVMANSPLLREPWAQYRTSLIMEQVPWFLEPRIFSTRRAEEIFTQESIMANRVNLPWYGQFPSLVTGLGLLLTFIALFIGLGKLHAEGGEIVGIQGLINGLAGKFLTSIVGLIVANIFTFIEKPMLSEVMHAHRQFLSLVDHLFPRKTIEQMLEQLTGLNNGRQEERSPAVTAQRDYRGPGMNGLAGSMASLTTAVQSLTRMQEDEQIETRRMMTEVPRLLKTELQPSLQELTETIHDLTKILKEAQPLVATVESPFEKRPLLWKNSADVMAPSATIPTGKSKPRLRWPRLSSLGRTG
ncbi:MAG: hypothetical protein MRJ96_05670 [Nitrospirales bacterium]|nr:hypothetical protein [Nitrospira sp.]MDR4500922.1 hypothetical protein [Nitrospirales bacterium]